MSLDTQVNEACVEMRKEGRKNLALKLKRFAAKKLQGPEHPARLQPA
jgi:hypothetical protein